MFERRLKYVGNDVELFEMAQRCGGNDLIV